MAKDLTVNLNSVWSESSLAPKNGGNKKSISLSFFGRGASFAIFESGQGGKLVTTMKLNLKSALFIAGILRQLKKSEAELKLNYVEQRWDPQSKRSVSGATLAFFRDANGCFGFDFIGADPAIGVIRFMFNGAGNFSDGGEPLSAARKSELGLDVLHHVLTVMFPTALLLSRFNETNATNNFRKGGNSAPRDTGASSGDFDSTSSAGSVWE